MLSPETRPEWRTLGDAMRPRPGDGDRPAVVYVRPSVAPVTVTREELWRQSARCAAGLTASGVQRGDVVIVAHADDLPPIFTFWGAVRIGAVPSMFPVPGEKLDAEAYRAAMTLLVQHAGARLVVTSEEHRALLAGLSACPVADFAALAGHSPDAGPAVEPDVGEIVLLQHSSGTTGLQKGVALSHAAVLNQLASYAAALELRASDVVVSWLPLYHDMGLIAGFLLPLVQGLPLVLMSPFDWVKRPALLLSAIHDHQATLCWLPNFAYNHCARRVLDRELTGLSIASIRTFINCSEPVLESSHSSFLERFRSIGARADQLGASYAMAENVFAVTQTPPGRPSVTEGAPEGAEDAPRHVSCGPPLPGVEVRIGDSRPEGEVGEIEIRSHCLLTGYHRRPDLDAGLFRNGWYRTGDLGYLRRGELYVVGRQKDVIIVGGKNLHPHDLESVVNEVEGVHAGRAVVFGVPDEEEGTERLVVVAEVDGDDAARCAEVKGAIRRALIRRVGVAAGQVSVVPRGWLVKTSSGKIARAENRKKWMKDGRATTS